MAATDSTSAPRLDPAHAAIVALHFDGVVLRAIDQTALPRREIELELRSAADVGAAIRLLAIRGAPLIGVAAGYGIAIELAHDASRERLDRACELLRSARPTAVNLAYAVDRVRKAVLRAAPEQAAVAAAEEARAIDAEEQAASDSIADHGAELLAGARRVMTHCNTGALAAPGRGTALAVIAELARRGSLASVIATESRPLLQGARLTVFELAKLGIEHELVVDAAAAGLICAGELDAVIVGCDRVAANGDVANKVGTSVTSEAQTPHDVHRELLRRSARHAGGARADLQWTDRPTAAGVSPAGAGSDRASAPAPARRRRAQGSRAPEHALTLLSDALAGTPGARRSGESHRSHRRRSRAPARDAER